MTRRIWIKVIALVAAVWLVAGGISLWMSYTKPTPDKLVRYLDTTSVGGKMGKDRDRVIDRVSDQLNALNYDQRREVRMSKKLDHFFRSLTPEEQGKFLDQTLPTGFKQMMEAFNKMTPEKRKAFVDRTLTDMRKNEGNEAPAQDDPHVRKMVDQGLKSFYSDASADVKMDFAPILEQMQKNLQFGR